MPFHKHIFGFRSADEFLLTISGLKHKVPAAFNLVLSSELSMLSLFVGVVEQWIWSPAYTLAFYMIVVTADFIAGLFVGMKVRNEGFLTQKALRLPAVLAAHMVLLGILFNAERINNDIGFFKTDPVIFSGVARTLYLYIIGVYVLSYIKNLVMLGIIKGGVAKFFQEHIDKQKNI